MSLADSVKLGIDRIGPALLFEIGNGSQWHLDMGIDKLLATFDVRQVQGCVYHGIQAADMGYETGRKSSKSCAEFPGYFLP